MNILFHHCRRTSGTWLKGVLAEVHGIHIDLCYSDDDIKACVNRLLFSNPDDMIVFGHRVRDIAGVFKAFRPGFMEIAMFRDPNEVVVSEFNYIRKTKGHHCHKAAMESSSALDFARVHLRGNPILSDIGDRMPDQWFSFYHMRDAYRRICGLIGVEPKQEVFDSIVQAEPTLPDMGLLNLKDYEFLREINIELPTKN